MQGTEIKEASIWTLNDEFSFLLSLQIEKFFPHILEKEKTRSMEEPSILSPEEFVFVKE